jgi:hypothetical protein
MTTIFERVKTALDTLSPIPVALEPYRVTPGASLPDTYITYIEVSDVPVAHYDDQETARDYLVQVNIFKRGGLVALPDVDAPMLAAGFTKDQRRQLPADEQTGHYHVAIDYRYHEENLP